MSRTHHEWAAVATPWKTSTPQRRGRDKLAAPAPGVQGSQSLSISRNPQRTKGRMKKLYASYDLVQAAQLKAILEDHHIACVIKNEGVADAFGRLAASWCRPELWIVEDELFDKASNLVAAFSGEVDASGPHWSCERCGECVEPVFTDCWNCGAPRVEA
ncbi:MAG: DUF2007 domain-containing protein [Gammaproteobacteria bacterium]